MKLALIIATTEYSDSNLAKLSAPSKDAEDLARVLKNKDTAEFDDVKIVLNQPESTVREEIDEFFDKKKPDDMLLLYFSGHGVRDEMGALYLALKNTNLTRLRATGIKSDFIREAMDQSYSKRQILILDCCNSGAFAQGTKASIGGSMGTATAFKGNGYGRVILTASDATQFAWEGNQLIGETQNSLFTHYLIEGLKGEADNDGDGKITIDDLYDYAYENIISKNPKQTPGKWSYSQKGEIVICQRVNLSNVKPLSLPDDLTDALTDNRTWVREGALKQLEILLNGKNLGLARSAREALEKVAAQDDSKSISSMAQQLLDREKKETISQQHEVNFTKSKEKTTKDVSNDSIANESLDTPYPTIRVDISWISWGRLIAGALTGLIVSPILAGSDIGGILFTMFAGGVVGLLTYPDKYFWIYLMLGFSIMAIININDYPLEYGLAVGLPIGAILSRIAAYYGFSNLLTKWFKNNNNNEPSSSNTSYALEKFKERINNDGLEKSAEEYLKRGIIFVEKFEFDDAIIEFIKTIKKSSPKDINYQSAKKQLIEMGFSETDIEGE